MNFEEFCFAEDSVVYNKPSPSHDSTLMESNDAQMVSSGQNSDSEPSGDQLRSLPITKFIRKKYDPIREGDRIIRFEDNPTEYRKARKKIQNRLSATRVRGKKKTHIEQVETEVGNLRAKNSELLLINAKLQAENNVLRQRVIFLEKLVMNKSQSEADSYLNTSPSPSTIQHAEYESPFENLQDEGSVWSRVTNSGKMSKEWLTLTIFTIMLAVIVVPANNGPEASMIAAKINDLQTADKQWLRIVNQMYNSTIELQSIKWYFKAVLITVYIAFIAYLLIVKLKILNRKKLKRF